MHNESAFSEVSEPAPKISWEPALLIGTIATVVSAGLVAINQAIADGTNVALAVLAAVLPLIAGAAIKQKVVSREWIRDVVRGADTVTDALRPIAEQAGTPARNIPRT